MKNRDCNLVRDLLPNYIERLTNDDTNLFIENHLKECSECSNILAAMKDGENKNEENKSKKFVKFSKKFRKKYKFLKYIVLLILFVIIFHTARNCFIYLSIAKKHNESISSKTNYHLQRYTYMKDSVSIEDWYYKDGKYLSKYTSVDLASATMFNPAYYYYDGKNIYVYDIKEKYYTIQEADQNTMLNPYEMSENSKMDISFLQLFFGAFLAKIDSNIVNGKECYRIIEPSEFNYGSYAAFDKTNGMLVKSSSGSSKAECDTFIYIDFDIVTDEDLIVPNIEEYVYKSRADMIIEGLNEAIISNDSGFIKTYLQLMLDENIEIPSEYYEKYKYLLEE